MFRVKSFFRESLFLVLEGFGHIHFLTDPQKHRTRIVREDCGEMPMQTLEIEILVDDQRRHARAAFTPRRLHAIDRRVTNARAAAQGVLDFEGRDIFALPSKGIADPIDKIIESTRIAPHEIAGAKPGVIDVKGIPEDLALRLQVVGIAFKSAKNVGTVDANPADRLADVIADPP